MYRGSDYGAAPFLGTPKASDVGNGEGHDDIPPFPAEEIPVSYSQGPL